MKIRRLYTNQPEVFPLINFDEGLSVVVAEIRVPENRLLDTHNLGKSTVGELIDFCLARRKSTSFFLFKHNNLFADFVFFLEIELPTGAFLTIGRPVTPGSKISFVMRDDAIEDASHFTEEDWDHLGVSF